MPKIILITVMLLSIAYTIMFGISSVCAGYCWIAVIPIIVTIIVIGYAIREIFITN